MSLQIIGTDMLTTVLRRFGQAAAQVAAAALFREGERIMTVAKGRTPVDTGALRGSGHVVPPETTAAGATVLLGFGGSAAPYAIYVHEDLTARHVVGEAKFLERSVDEARRGMDARLAADVKAQLERVTR